MKYQFTGYDQRTYPDFVVDGKVLVVNPGDIRELTEVPTDGYWSEVESHYPEPDPKPKPAKSSKENQA